jgi:hypothetical protein
MTEEQLEEIRQRVAKVYENVPQWALQTALDLGHLRDKLESLLPKSSHANLSVQLHAQDNGHISINIHWRHPCGYFSGTSAGLDLMYKPNFAETLSAQLLEGAKRYRQGVRARKKATAAESRRLAESL